MRGLDASFSSISRDWFRAQKLAGYGIFVQDGWTGAESPAPTRFNLRNAREEGFITAVYACTNKRPGAEAVDRALMACADEYPHIAAIFIDVELETTEKIVRDACEYAAALKKTAIYSAKWAWEKYAGNWVWARDYKLWVAQYDMVPDRTTAVPFSPFTSQNIIGKQYAGTTDINGVDVDLNDFDETFFQEEDMPLTDAEMQNIANLTRDKVIEAMRSGEFQLNKFPEHVGSPEIAGKYKLVPADD